jgi:hypothetical protein
MMLKKKIDGWATKKKNNEDDDDDDEQQVEGKSMRERKHGQGVDGIKHEQ